MASPAICLELDRAIDTLLADHAARLPRVDSTLRELVEVGAELRHAARRDFRAGLKQSLTGKTARPHLVAKASDVARDLVLPSLFQAGESVAAVRRGNLALSFLAHAAALALVLTSGLWITGTHEQIKTRILASGDSVTYILPPMTAPMSGGGGGGDQSKTPASKGTPPRFAVEQFTPPAVVLRNPDPKLPMPPTVIGPPDLKLPQSNTLGDPLSAALTPSNGPGSGGGIGDGRDGGVGGGNGPGVGRGSGGGYGDGPFMIGGGVTAPRVISAPDPEFSEEARKAKHQGVVVLWVVVGADGRVKDARVARSLGMGLDEKARESVMTWRFEPARKNGVPVAVQLNVEVTFRIY